MGVGSPPNNFSPMNNFNIHKRRSIRLKDYDYSSPGEYFITICTFQRECTFGDIRNESVYLSNEGIIIKRHWEEIPNHFENVELDEFIIMPNHLHGIIVLKESVGAIHESPLRMTQQQRRIMTLPKIIGRFKMESAKEINVLHKTPGHPVWQRNYYEHIIRDEKDFENISPTILSVGCWKKIIQKAFRCNSDVSISWS